MEYAGSKRNEGTYPDQAETKCSATMWKMNDHGFVASADDRSPIGHHHQTSAMRIAKISLG